MNEKSLSDYIFDLLDYADEINKLIKPGIAENDSYFMTLVYIEDILDKYGRGFVRNSSSDGSNKQQSSSDVNSRLNELRATIRKHSQMYDFDETLRQRGDSMLRDWRKLPPDHPNVQHMYQ